MNNVYADPAYAEIQEQLKDELVRLKERVGDTDDLMGPAGARRTVFQTVQMSLTVYDGRRTLGIRRLS